MSWTGARTSDAPSTGDGDERRSDILKLILYDLNSAIAPAEHRLLALQSAISEFDHDEDWKHDEELDLHADKILLQKLAFCFTSNPNSEEVAMICTALEMVYRASRQRIALSFSELRESVLPIFVSMLNKPLRYQKLEELEQAILEAEQKRSSGMGSYKSSTVAKDMEDSYSYRNDDPPKPKASSYDDDQTYATYDDGYPQKPKSSSYDDDQTYATYDDGYPQKPKSSTYDDDQTYATYDDGYPQKPKPSNYDNDQSYATYEDEYPQKPKPSNYDNDQSYATYEDDYPKKPKASNYDDNDQSYGTYDDDYPKKPKPSNYDDDQTYDASFANNNTSYANNDASYAGESYVEHEDGTDPETLRVRGGAGGDDSYAQQSYANQSFGEDSYVDNGASYVDNGASYVQGEESYRDQYEVETVMSEDTYGNSLGKPVNPKSLDEDDTSTYSTYIDAKFTKPGFARDDATIYTTDGMHPIAEGDLKTISEGSGESFNEYSESFGVEKSFSNQVPRPSTRSVNDAPSVASNARSWKSNPPSVPASRSVNGAQSVVSNAARSWKEQKRQKEQQREGNAQIQRLEGELKILRFDIPANHIAVGRSLQVLRYFSRVLSAMVQLAHHPGMLDALVYQLERQPYGKYKEHFFQYENGEPRAEDEKEELHGARIDAIATIVNLACAEENKIKIANHKGLLDAVADVANNDESEEAREHAAIVLMNLAYEDENKVMMVQHNGMLQTLVKLLQDESPFTRRYSSAALFTLACVVGNTERMASFCDGEILECLKRVLNDDPVDEARINAAEALFNMARNNTEETVQLMGDHPNLLASLAKAVLTDYSADVRVYCARALEWMAADVHYPMECHRTLLSALTVSAQWTKTSCIAEAIQTQATLSENRLPMAAHDGMLQAISNLALMESMGESSARKSAIAALEMISREPAARKYMVHNEQVMRSLTKASFEKRGEFDDEDEFDNDDEGTVTAKMIKNALKNLADNM